MCTVVINKQERPVSSYTSKAFIKNANMYLVAYAQILKASKKSKKCNIF